MNRWFIIFILHVLRVVFKLHIKFQKKKKTSTQLLLLVGISHCLLFAKQQNSFEWNCSSKFFSYNSSFMCLFFSWIRWSESEHNGILHLYFYEMAKTINIHQKQNKVSWMEGRKNAHIPIMNTTRAQHHQHQRNEENRQRANMCIASLFLFFFFMPLLLFAYFFLLYLRSIVCSLFQRLFFSSFTPTTVFFHYILFRGSYSQLIYTEVLKCVFVLSLNGFNMHVVYVISIVYSST